MNFSKFDTIYKVPDSQKYWVVRANSGRFLANFVQGNCIAISHLDSLALPEVGHFTNKDLEGIGKKLKREFSGKMKTKRQLSSNYNQILKFVKEMNVGDLVLTPVFGRVLIGRITGGAQINKEVISVITDEKKDTSIDMEHNLRRPVEWGPTVRRATFPISITRSLRANQTVFNIDDHWEALHHLIYPIFQKGNQTYVSFRVERPGDIDNYSVSRFLNFLSETEVFAEYLLTGHNWDNKNFNEYFIDSLAERAMSFTIKAQFMSEGEIDGSFKSEVLRYISSVLPNKTAKNLIIGSCICFALFGMEDIGYPGIIDKDTKQAIVNFVLERWEKNHGEAVKQNLMLQMPNYNTKFLEKSEQENPNELEK